MNSPPKFEQGRRGDADRGGLPLDPSRAGDGGLFAFHEVDEKGRVKDHRRNARFRRARDRSRPSARDFSTMLARSRGRMPTRSSRGGGPAGEYTRRRRLRWSGNPLHVYIYVYIFKAGDESSEISRLPRSRLIAKRTVVNGRIPTLRTGG